VTEKIAKKHRPLSTCKTFTNHAHWVIGEPGWVEIADDVAEWLISTTTCKTPDVHGSTNVPVGNALGVRGDMDIKDAYILAVVFP